MSPAEAEPEGLRLWRVALEQGHQDPIAGSVAPHAADEQAEMRPPVPCPPKFCQNPVPLLDVAGLYIAGAGHADIRV